jgi:aminopeptidase N
LYIDLVDVYNSSTFSHRRDFNMAQSAPAETIYLKDYTAPPFFVETVHLTFDLGVQKTQVINVLSLYRNPAASASADLFLDGDELIFVSLLLEGVPLATTQYSVTDKGLLIRDLPSRCVLTITTECDPQKNTKLSGLYRSQDLYCTQCEPHGFRRITYYLDRPDVLARFTTNIIADKAKYPVLLANGNCIEVGDLPQGRHYAIWEDPFKKPAYLFALVAGQLSFYQDTYHTLDNRTVDLRIYVEPHNLKRCEHAMWSLKESMKWDEIHYGRIYDLDIFMIVAVRDFNFGAMENKGLNIFNEKYILADAHTATDQDYMNIARVVAHEYFHNWSGNRVTCRDWFQLSLKEGLTVFRDQSFSEDYFGKAISRIGEVNLLRTAQFLEDAGPMAHPVRPSSYVEVNNFYTLTVYEKGAELIRMQKQLVGDENYRLATDLYFSRFDGQAATCDDFLACMAEASSQDLTQFKFWYCQAGTPVVNLETQVQSDGSYVMTFMQTCPATPEQKEKHPFMIPISVSLFHQNGQPLPLQLQGEKEPTGTQRLLILTQTTQSFRFQGIPADAVCSVLRGFSAPIKLNKIHDPAALAFLIRHDTDGFNRFDAAFQYANWQLQRLIEDPNVTIDQSYLDAMHQLLKEPAIDKRLLAVMITPPSKHYLAEQMPVILVERIEAAHRQFKKCLAENFHEELLVFINEKQLRSPYRFELDAIADRAMRFAALDLLTSLDDDKVFTQCDAWYDLSNNMTDQFNILSAVNHSAHPVRQKLMNAFYEQFKHDSLVMDKWLRLQATADLPGTIDTVKELLNHPLFDVKNPNKVYALLGGFGSNLSQCHQRDGAGYYLLQTQIERLNAINPQVATRVLSPLTQWRRFDKDRQIQMRSVLEALAIMQDLSKDLFEVVSKSLAD